MKRPSSWLVLLAFCALAFSATAGVCCLPPAQESEPPPPSCACGACGEEACACGEDCPDCPKPAEEGGGCGTEGEGGCCRED
ncbi:MAG: hypothetical protein ACLFR7_00200 [Opitutales bacterium]